MVSEKKFSKLLFLFEPLRYDEFYNMALKQEAAQLRCDVPRSESEMLLLLPLLKWPSSRSIGFLLLRSGSRISRRAKVAVVSPTHPTQAFRTKLSLILQGQVLLITVRSQRLLATSVSRKGTMQTSASTKGAFRLLLL